MARTMEWKQLRDGECVNTFDEPRLCMRFENHLREVSFHSLCILLLILL